MPRSSTASVSLQPDHASEHPVDLCHVLDTCAESDKAIWELLQQIYKQCLELLERHLWDNNPNNVPRRGWFGFRVDSTEQLLQLDVVSSARGKTHLLTFLQPLRTPPPKLEQLAMTRVQQNTIRELLHQPSGMVLIASDIAHARARTARAFAQELVAPDKKIVCVDSPGHPLLPRTTQLAIDNPPTDQQVQNWKAMCQMGCDAVIACQTLDDKLTPDLAHLATEQTFVIQSAKVKSAADAVASLLALGVRREAIARSLSAVIVLRQAQCLCQYCRTSAVPDDEATHWLAEYSPIKPSDINEWLRHRMRSSFSQASGCNRCGNSGIGNALEIYDIVPLDDTVRDALYDSDVRFALSYLQEKTSLSAQLLRLAQEGIISLNEAMRLVQPTPIEPYT